MQPNLAENAALQPIAVCPEHPERASIAPCERCGRFLCDECLASRSPPRCPACNAKARDPLGVVAQPFSIGGALGNGWKLFTSTLPQLLPICLLVGVFGGLLTHALESNNASSSSMRFGRIFDGTVGLFGIGAYLALLVGKAEGAPRGVGAALKESMNAWPRLFGARFRSGWTILLFTLLLVIPGIMKAVTFAVVTEAAFREPASDALDNSTSLTEGRRWEVFGLFVACYGIVLLCAFLIGIMGGILMEVVPGTEAIANILIDAGVRVGEAFAAGVALATFYGLKHSKGQELAPLNVAE
jgi:hypothetical protein